MALDLWDPSSPRLTYYARGTSSRPNQQWTFVDVRRLSAVKKSKTCSQAELTQLDTYAKKLYAIYREGYGFPTWALDKFQHEFSTYAPTVEVYYDPTNSALDVVKKLVTEREPVNIGMFRAYDENMMAKTFGWSQGYYGRFYLQEGVVAPNVGIYCQTPVQVKPGVFKDVHIYNAIGYAFDTTDQPDYLYFVKGDNQHQLPARYEQVFSAIYTCAESKGLQTVVMSLIGANNFAIEYSDADGHGPAHFQQTVWAPALRRAMSRFPDITTKLMGTNPSTRKNLDLADIVDIGRFPANVNLVEITTTLFVNAWDPWSFVGNGNERDNSLDGFMGRCTVMALLCWPKTNPCLTYVPTNAVPLTCD
jgi:hypothetical protein